MDRAAAIRLWQLAVCCSVLFVLLGCSKMDNRGAWLEASQLDGAELGSLLQVHSGKYVYHGDDKFYFWRMSASLYGPDDQLVERISLGAGGCGLNNGDSFFLIVPIEKEGEAVIRFSGMTTKKLVPRLLPESESAFASSWNSRVPIEEGKAMILGLFALDQQSSLTYPNLTLPKGLGGHLVAVTLELQESEAGRTNPFH